MADPKQFPAPPSRSEILRRVVEQAVLLEASAVDSGDGRLVSVMIVVNYDERSGRPRAVSVRPEFKHDIPT